MSQLRIEDVTMRIARNGSYNQTWQMNAYQDKLWVPMDLTSYVVLLKFGRVAGQGPVIASASIEIDDPEAGQFQVLIAGSSFASIEGQTEIVTLAYDLKLKDPDGIPSVPISGHALLIPGVS